MKVEMVSASDQSPFFVLTTSLKSLESTGLPSSMCLRCVRLILDRKGGEGADFTIYPQTLRSLVTVLPVNLGMS